MKKARLFRTHLQTILWSLWKESNDRIFNSKERLVAALIDFLVANVGLSFFPNDPIFLSSVVPYPIGRWTS